MVSTLSANAQGIYYWQDDGWDDEPPPVIRYEPAPRSRYRHHAPKVAKAVREKTIAQEKRKPQGPLVIAISLDRQRLTLYDANGIFAESRISTGMRGHGTPMGVFSVIQKQKWHRSNIYSGAPMPYMQRITWSGIALHAGVVPGYPASHGCIRMPAGFATRMYGWTRLGARVIIAPGDITPTDITHALLPTERPKPAITVSSTPQAEPPPADADKTAGADTTAMAPHDPVRTADASGAVPHLTTAAIASASGTDAGQPKPDKLELRSGLDVSADTSVVQPSSTDKSVPGEVTLSDESASATVGIADGKSAAAAESSPAKPAESAAADISVDGAAAKDPAQATGDKSVSTPASIAKPVPKRTGRIAVFISSKDSKIYVRQNFAPLFDAPITIAAGDRPLGTHIFTAETEKADKDHFHWSVVSLPAMSHRAERPRDRSRKHGQSEADVAITAAPQTDSASEALDRITIPDSVMSQIAGSLSSGSSIIVSDVGVKAGGETGEGTDFIIPLR